VQNEIQWELRTAADAHLRFVLCVFVYVYAGVCVFVCVYVLPLLVQNEIQWQLHTAADAHLRFVLCVFVCVCVYGNGTRFNGSFILLLMRTSGLYCVCLCVCLCVCVFACV